MPDVKETPMNDRSRSANMLGALAVAINGQLLDSLKRHPNQTDSSAAALRVIALFEGCTNGQLGAVLRLSHSATVRLLEKLSDAGLVEVRTGTDRRSVALHLTKAGRARVSAVLRARSATLARILDVLTPAQRRTLDAVTETLLDRLTTSPVEGAHICRLCDDRACPPDRCPVHLKAVRLDRTPARQDTQSA